nr:hypothetical protein [Nocardioides faecalis]
MGQAGVAALLEPVLLEELDEPADDEPAELAELAESDELDEPESEEVAEAAGVVALEEERLSVL